MISEKLNSDLTNKFSTLYHATKIEYAKNILHSRKIFGCDTHQHANLSVNGRTDIANYHEVLLEFRWDGNHETMISGGDFAPKHWKNGPAKDVMYHVFTDEPPKGGYWQSNLFPGSEGLVFVKCIPLFDICHEKNIFQRLLSSESRSEHKGYLYQKDLLKFLNSFAGQSLGVLAWDESMHRRTRYGCKEIIIS
jgi:hypothetical protein